MKRSDEEEAQRGGIIIPDTAREKPHEGTVVAVGAGKVADDGTKIPLAVKEGDRVLFGKYSGSEVLITDSPERARRAPPMPHGGEF